MEKVEEIIYNFGQNLHSQQYILSLSVGIQVGEDWGTILIKILRRHLWGS